MKVPDDLRPECGLGLPTYTELSARNKLQRHRYRGETGWRIFYCENTVDGSDGHWHVGNAERRGVMDEVTKKLYATTNASVWAEEWCKIAREIEAADDGRQVIDEGWMIGWFANMWAVTHDTEVAPLKAAIEKALSELGVPGPDYPAPVANAVEILSQALGADDHASD